MSDMGIDLPLVWAIIILFGILMYVIMDGFDLGIGILFPFIPRDEDRDLMMNTVAPVWDGNETWLVMGGAGLLAAFPLAYSVILHAFMLPLIFMLLGLVFRGVAFEFRFKSHAKGKHWWDKAFIFGSFSATFFQGMTLGAYIDGLRVVNGAYAGHALEWISPFSVFTGLGLIVAYALLGCTWLIFRTEGPLHDRMRKLARPLMLLLLAVIVIISIWTPLNHSAIAERWFSLPNMFLFAPVPLLVVFAAFLLLRSLNEEPHAAPFLLTLCLIFLGYSGLGISVWPNIIPPDISIWEASGPAESQGFTLVGALLIIPLILMYTAWSYYVFRGKVTTTDGYH
jgi:cytochrome d ubiquinol oxidase subunit II